ncbi:MAG: translation initiation factor IF-2 N-terminal domain-containing protein, partial [Oscillospiraceae bacterium]|nr:translation initiation factor IF-2 N-terminal domain-containing protein [Oscillospiraceae bacterium]
MEVALLGNIVNKYKVNELARDFGMQTKAIIEILGKYFDTPKKSGQNLEDKELAVVFEYLTQNNQASSIQSIYADAAPAEKAPSPEAAPQQKKPEAPKVAEAGKSRPAPQRAPQQSATPAAPAQPGAAKPAQPGAARVPKTKVVDTRKATNVNLDKYDEKLQDMADRSGAGGGRRDREAGKEKFRSAGGKKRGQMTFSSKRRQEEAEKMRRLQLEIAKKTPLTVKIPDEISVQELASRMKKTGAEVVKCLMKNGVMASLSQFIDFDTAAITAEELGCKVEREVVVTIEE